MNDINILVITSNRSKQPGNSWPERERAVQEFCTELENRLDNVTVLYTTYADLTFTANLSGLSIYDTRNDLDVADVQFVHFKNWQYDLSTAPVVANYLVHKEVPFANTEVLNSAAIGKLSQMFQLSMEHIPIPATYAASMDRFVQLAEHNLPKSFSYPVIFKADDGAKGEDNYLVRTSAEFKTILSTIDHSQEFILQEFIPNDGDYRYLFIGLDTDPLVFLRKGSNESHLNNTSKGGEGTFQALTGPVAENLVIARNAAAVTNKQISGVDIIVNRETNEPYVLEINGTPAIATGFGKEEKLNIFASFISEQVEAQEEE